MLKCSWYISSSVSDELAQVIHEMSEAFRTHARDLELDVIDSKSFGYKSFTERFRNFMRHKDIWHLFGKAPVWWRIVRLHSRTVHTMLEGNARWSGYPSRFFTEGALSGEAVIYPVFDSLGSHTEDTERAVYVNGTNSLVPEGDYTISDISGKILRPEALSGIYFASDTGPYEAMRAGLLTMRGLAVASGRSGYLDELLGPGGYFVIDEGDITRIIRQGLGEKGRHIAVAARHFLKSRRSHERCADSLMALYRRALSQ